MAEQSEDMGVENLAEDTLPKLDYETFHKAGCLVWDIFQKDDEWLIETFYMLMNGLNNGVLAGVNISEIVRRNPRDGVELSDKVVNNYWLHVLQTEDEPSGCDQVWGRKIVGDILYQVHLDAPIGAMLMCKDKPNAILGLSLSDPYTLRINQMQGVTAHRVDDLEKQVYPKGLFQLDWTKALVDCAEEIAGNLGLDCVSIIRAENIVWTKQNGMKHEIHLPMDRARRLYNNTAERLGYKNMNGEWRKKLE